VQKKLIALAVAGLASSAAFAQSNVTVYGIADVYYGHASFSGLNSQNTIGSGGLSGSRLGFKGVEDLGNGLKALFTLEYALAVDDNKGVGSGNGGASLTAGSSNTARQQFAGLTGGFGTVVAGRLQTAGYDFSAATNVFHGTAINPLLTVQKNLSNTLSGLEVAGSLLSQNSRANNAVAYISPDFNGFKVAYNHARLTENTNVAGGTGDDSSANLLRGWYDNGPLHLDAIYSKIAAKSVVTTTGTDISEWGLGVGYDFGVVALKASYQSSKDELVSDEKNKAWQVSAAVPVSTAGKVLFGYAKNTINSVNDADTKSYTLAYTHSLSKRTTLYTGIQHVTNDNGARVSTAGITNGGAGNALGDLGGSGNLFVGGINHAF